MEATASEDGFSLKLDLRKEQRLIWDCFGCRHLSNSSCHLEASMRCRLYRERQDLAISGRGAFMWKAYCPHFIGVSM